MAVVKEAVFNQKKRPLRRTRIPVWEVLASVAVLACLAAMVIWYASKRGDFNPEERDISTALLTENSVTDTLYRTPVQRWAEPGQAGGDASPALGIFPAGVLDGGWQAASRVQDFDKETLYEKIDGAAEQYFQFGFKMLRYLSIGKADADLEISMELYDMESFQNALGIFAAQKDASKATEPVGAAHCYWTEAGAIGIFNNIYFKLSGNSGDKAILDKSRQLIETLSKIDTGEAKTPAPFVILTEKLKIPFERISYEKQDVFQYDFAKDFWFGRPAADSDLQYYLHAAANEEEAASLFAKILENHLYDYDVVDKKETDVVFKHKFLNTFMTLQRRGAMVFGVDNVTDEAALKPATAQLAAALNLEASGSEQ